MDKINVKYIYAIVSLVMIIFIIVYTDKINLTLYDDSDDSSSEWDDWSDCDDSDTEVDMTMPYQEGIISHSKSKSTSKSKSGGGKKKGKKGKGKNKKSSKRGWGCVIS